MNIRLNLTKMKLPREDQLYFLNKRQKFGCDSGIMVITKGHTCYNHAEQMEMVNHKIFYIFKDTILRRLDQGISIPHLLQEAHT